MPESHLQAAYAARSPSDVAQTYDQWAASYDEDMARAGYQHPAICVALLARHVPRATSPILDAGAGTGLVGRWLGMLGYPHVEALDASRGMLQVARAKNVYRELHYGVLGEPLPFDDGRFAAIVSAGVFTTGHVGVEALDELLRVLQPGGVVVCTVKESLWDESFAARIDQAAVDGALAVVETTPRYVSMPRDAAATPGLCVVLRKA